MALPGGMEHPVILHLYCHLMELSADPVAAMPAADVLRHLFPLAGHLIHMASHIDIWAGHYKVCGTVTARGSTLRDSFRSRRCEVGTATLPLVNQITNSMFLDIALDKLRNQTCACHTKARVTNAAPQMHVALPGNYCRRCGWRRKRWRPTLTPSPRMM